MILASFSSTSSRVHWMRAEFCDISRPETLREKKSGGRQLQCRKRAGTDETNATPPALAASERRERQGSAISWP